VLLHSKQDVWPHSFAISRTEIKLLRRMWRRMCYSDWQLLREVALNTKAVAVRVLIGSL
jgi:hypothetical protein